MNSTYLLHQAIDNSAGRFPDQAAFRSGSRVVSFAQAATLTNQLAALLLELGLKRSDRVGIYLHRNVESALAVHGILKAGGAFVPLDPAAPTERTKLIIKDCGIQHIISEDTLASKLASVIYQQPNLHVIGISTDEIKGAHSWAEVEQLPTQLTKSHRILESDLAYIMYTSGTTGQPKGIMHTHFSGLSYAKLSAELYDVNEKDVFGNHSPLHFDMSTMGYLTAPYAGATSVIIPAMYTMMPASLSKLAEDEKLTIWYSVPLALIQMLQRGAIEQRDLSSIRWVLFGGEPFPAKHLADLMKKWPQATFSNVYGPAEVNQCTYYNLPNPPAAETVIPLGSVWDDTEVRIHNEEGEDVRTGEAGELLVRSTTMMKGYWNQPELSKKSIQTIEGVGQFYKTGDVVKKEKDGLLYFMGRMDRQIKTRGHRVELNEVEATLITHPNVNNAAAYAINEEDGNKIIAALVVLNEEKDTHELQEHIRNFMPEYSVPKYIFVGREIPRTPAGKIDYKTLTKQAESTI